MKSTAQADKSGRVAVAMSGGLDSSVAAALLVDEGREVIGLTAHMWKEGSRCCSVEDVKHAREVAWFLGIRHYVLNASELFNRDIVDPFVTEYLEGKTPSPCVTCNRKIKFGFLMTRAVQFDCSFLATGHYARVERTNGHYHLFKAKDRTRDQSYFLHRLSQRQLAHTIFPLADYVKEEDVRSYARRRSLPLTPRKESQDLCFITNGQYSQFVEARSRDAGTTGAIIDQDGQELGTHEGIHRYTVGQRRGLGVASTKPLYVTRIDAQRKTVEVGPRESTMTQTCILQDINWISGYPSDTDRTFDLRIRYRHEAAPARIQKREDGSLQVNFLTPQFAVTPGQAGVIYDGDEVLGGGWIAAQ